MTIVILDRGPDARPPYADWLAGKELVLITDRAVDTGGYAEVRRVQDYAATVELTVLELAATRQISALVATATPDLVRAGALRDHLGIRGQSRADATVFADPVAMRERLKTAGVPVVPAGAVLHVADLYWYQHQWGPLRVRRRNEPGWPTAAVLRDEADLRAFTANGLAPSLVSAPSLFAEPYRDGDRRTVVEALDGLPATPGHPYRVHLLHAGEWLVDTVEPAVGRDAVRAQAGLPPLAEEVTRWAS